MKDATAAASLERIARMYLRYGQADAAATLLEAAAELDPGNSSVRQLRVLAAFSAGAYADAIALAQHVPDDAAAFATSLPLLEAICLVRLGKIEAARARFEAMRPANEKIASNSGKSLLSEELDQR